MVAVISVDAYPFWLSQTWPVTLRIQEYVLSGCIVMPNGKETKLGSIDQEFSPSAGKSTRVVLVPCCTWTCVPTSVSSGMDTWEIPRCHILRQMSSQWVSQKLLQGLVSPEFTAYLSIFNQFKLNELWSYYQKQVNLIILNCATHNSLYKYLRPLFEFCWSQIFPLAFLLCVRQTWMIELILAISLWEVIFL